MGIATTYIVTRDFALAAISRRLQFATTSQVKTCWDFLSGLKLKSMDSTPIYERKWSLWVAVESASDSEVADVLDVIIHNGFFNFRVVSQSEFDENCARPSKEWNGMFHEDMRRPFIDNLDYLPEYNDAH